MKKLLKALFTLALVITCLCAVSMQTKAATVANGTCGKNGNNLTWSLDNTGTLTISGIGKMCDYGYQYNTPSGSTQPWKNFPETIKKVVIGNNVTSIGAYAFKGCENLISVTIPNSVTAIGDNAFEYCERLTTASIPDSVTSVGKDAFLWAGLPFKIYENGKYIGNSSNPYAVLVQVQDKSITSFNIHKDTKVISDSVFLGCNNLESIKIPDKVTHIGDDAFSYKEKLTSVTIGNSVISIGNAAFGWCPSLTSVTIPDSVITIGNDAFRSCEGLKSIKIGNSVKTIGDEAFENCNHITSVTLPDTVTSIGYRAFADCYMLISASLGDGLTSVSEDAFTSCSNLTSVTLGKSVTAIGDRAFSNCESLTSMIIPDSITFVGSRAFDSTNLTYNVYDNGKYLGNSDNPYVALIEATSQGITSCNIHQDTQAIAGYAFHYCQRMESVVIPNGIITIGDSAFYYCKRLTEVIIPDSVTTIGASAFGQCRSLVRVRIPDSVDTIGGYAFDGCSNLSYNVYDNGKYLGNNRNPYFALIAPKSEDIKSCDIHQDTKMIVSGAFLYCNDLTQVAVPIGVTTIGSNVFWTCESLKEVYYGGSKEHWLAIDIGSSNEPLTKATIYTNCTGLPRFPDVKPNAWYHKAVEFAVDKGYFSGNGDGTFGPGNNITRQDFVVVLSRIAGANLSKYSGQTSFTDVKPNAYYAKAIHWATANGVISGYNATKFGVGDALTREQLVTILSRYAAKKGVNVTATDAAKAKLNTYSDANKVNPVMKNAVAWALQNKVISGMTATTVGPQGNATRAQVAAILFNINSYKIIPGI